MPILKDLNGVPNVDEVNRPRSAINPSRCRVLYWLVYKSNATTSVVIQPAGNIITARMLAMLDNVPGEFRKGHELDDKTAKKVPANMIGRVLSRKEATALLKKLDGQSQWIEQLRAFVSDVTDRLINSPDFQRRIRIRVKHRN
jgi:hypothetical protein